MVNVNICHWIIILILWFNISLCRFSKSRMLTNCKNKKVHPNKISLQQYKYAIKIENKFKLYGIQNEKNKM